MYYLKLYDYNYKMHNATVSDNISSLVFSGTTQKRNRTVTQKYANFLEETFKRRKVRSTPRSTTVMGGESTGVSLSVSDDMAEVSLPSDVAGGMAGVSLSGDMAEVSTGVSLSGDMAGVSLSVSDDMAEVLTGVSLSGDMAGVSLSVSDDMAEVSLPSDVAGGMAGVSLSGDLSLIHI